MIREHIEKTLGTLFHVDSETYEYVDNLVLEQIKNMVHDKCCRSGDGRSPAYGLCGAVYDIGTEWVNPSGTFPKRLAKVIKERTNYTLDADFLAQIGEIAKRSTQAVPSGYRFDFTNSIRWRSGDFGDSGSCFWNGRDEARRIIEANGFAFRAHRLVNAKQETLGIARCWIAADFPRRDMITAFNFYGWQRGNMLSALKKWMSKVLQIELEKFDFKFIVISNPGASILYLNGDTQLIGERDRIAKISGKLNHPLNWSRYSTKPLTPVVHDDDDEMDEDF